MNLQAIGFWQGRERAMKYVPRAVLVFIFLAFISQVILHIQASRQSASFRQLGDPPSLQQMQILALADPVALSRFTMLWLQSYDDQPGISTSFRQLDYNNLVAWLDLVLKLDVRTQYPLLAASRVYSEVADEFRKRRAIDFVARKFPDDPVHRWPSMAHAVFVAKHKLKDLELALQYAQILATNLQGVNAPAWVKQMHIFVLEDMGELESAKVLLGGLLESGEVTDDQELRFLHFRLKQLEKEITSEN